MGANFLKTLDESLGICKAVVIAGDDGKAWQDIFALIYRGLQDADEDR